MRAQLSLGLGTRPYTRALSARAAAQHADPEASRAADQALHDAIARATHNPYLVGINRQMRAQLSLGLGTRPYTRALSARAAAQHADLIAAVAEGLADEAARVAARHVSLTQSSMRELRPRAGAAEASG